MILVTCSILPAMSIYSRRTNLKAKKRQLLSGFMAFLGFFGIVTKHQLAHAEHDFSNHSAAHHVGECYAGGIIFYVNKTPNAPRGERGLVVARADLVNSFAWDTNPSGQDVPKTQAGLFGGKFNESTILSTMSGSRAQAVSAARRYTDGTYHDWYLPAQHELSTLYFQALARGPKFWTACGGVVPSAATYWSSTQDGAINAWGVSFAGGVVVVAHKNNSFLVRPVRAF